MEEEKKHGSQGLYISILCSKNASYNFVMLKVECMKRDHYGKVVQHKKKVETGLDSGLGSTLTIITQTGRFEIQAKKACPIILFTI